MVLEGIAAQMDKRLDSIERRLDAMDRRLMLIISLQITTVIALAGLVLSR